MTIFFLFVGIGLVANIYIICGVTQECWNSRRKSGVVERISASSSNSGSIGEYRGPANARSEHIA